MSKRKLIIKIKLSSKRFYKLDLTYFLENWGAPFIITFMILLITAAAYLALGNELTANKLAEYAYYNLVAGVLLQLTCFIREERKHKHESHDGAKHGEPTTKLAHNT